MRVRKQELGSRNIAGARVEQRRKTIGMKQKGEKARMNWNEVYGKSGVCHVEIHNYKKPNDKEGEKTGRKNQINKLYPTYDQPQITTASQPTQNSWKPGNF